MKTAEDIYEHLHSAASEIAEPDDIADDLLLKLSEALATVLRDSEHGGRGPNAKFSMFSREGNDMLASAIDNAFNMVKDKPGPVYRKYLLESVKRHIALVAAKHPEVHDTEPQWAVVDAVNLRLAAMGMAPIGREDL